MAAGTGYSRLRATMQRASSSRRQRASAAVRRVISGGSFNKRNKTHVRLGMPPAPQPQGASKRKAAAAFTAPVPAVASGPLKRQRTWSNALIRITGGQPQSQRVIGYHRTKTHIDCRFRVGGGSSVDVHRHVVLTNTNGFKLADAKGVELPPPCHSTALAGLVDFWYTGECEVAECFIVQFLETAHHLKASSAVAAATRAFEPYINEANCLELLFLAERLALPSAFVQAAEACVREEFEAVRTRRQFLKVSFDLIRSLVSDPATCKACEESVFEAAVEWVRAQETPPSASTVKELLEPIDYTKMNGTYVREVVMCHPIVVSHPDRHGLLLESFLQAAYGHAEAPTHGSDSSGECSVLGLIAATDANVPM